MCVFHYRLAFKPEFTLEQGRTCISRRAFWQILLGLNFKRVFQTTAFPFKARNNHRSAPAVISSMVAACGKVCCASSSDNYKAVLEKLRFRIM